MSKPGFVFDGIDWVGFTGARGEPGGGINLIGELADKTKLPAAASASHGDAYSMKDTGHLWVFDAATNKFKDSGSFRGEKGDPGETLKISGAVAEAHLLPLMPENLSVYMVSGSAKGSPDIDNPGSMLPSMAGHLFIYDPTSPSMSLGPTPPIGYVDLGAIAGPKGEKGDMGPQGPPSRFHMVSSYTQLLGTTVDNGDGTFTTIPGMTGAPGDVYIATDTGVGYQWVVTLDPSGNKVGADWVNVGRFVIEGKPAMLRGTVATAADLPSPANPGDWCFVADEGHVYGWDPTLATPAWVDRGALEVIPNGFDDMDILTWDAADQKWVPSVNNFGDEANVRLSTDDDVTDGGVPIYEASLNEWDVRRLALEDLDDIRGIVPNDGDILTFDATTNKWEVREGGLNVTANADGDVITWDGNLQEWVARVRPNHVMYFGNGALDFALVADETRNFGMPLNTLPDPATIPAQAGDFYMDTDTGGVSVFMGESGTPTERGTQSPSAVVIDAFFLNSSIRGARDFMDHHDAGSWRNAMPIVWSEDLGKFYVGDANVNVAKWNSTDVYKKYDLVEHNGELFLCLPHLEGTSQNNEPGYPGNKHWVQVNENVKIWQPGTNYPAGAIVAVPQHQEYWNNGDNRQFINPHWDPATVYQFYISAYPVRGDIPVNPIDKQSPAQVPPGYAWWEHYDVTNASQAARRTGTMVEYVSFWQPLEGSRTYIFDKKEDLAAFSRSDGNYREGDLAIVFSEHDTKVYRWELLKATYSYTTHFWAEQVTLNIHGNASGGPFLRFHNTTEMHDVDPANLSQFQRAYVETGDGGTPEIWQYIKTQFSGRDPGWYFVYRMDYVDPQVHNHDLEIVTAAMGELVTEVGVLQTGVRHMAAVKSRTDTPPAAPTAGDHYIVKATDGSTPPDAKGDFKGHVNAIAIFDGSAWSFAFGTKGDAHYVQDVKETWIWSGTEWVKASDNGGATDLVSLSDVNAKTPKAGNALVYDATTKKWVARDVGTTEMGRWYVEGRNGGLYHSRYISLPDLTGTSNEYVEFQIDFRAINLTHTNTGYPEIVPRFKPGHDWVHDGGVFGLKKFFSDGNWHMRAYNGYEASKESWVYDHNVKLDRINTGVPTQSGGWVTSVNRPINGYIRISRNLYKYGHTTFEWDWFGPSYNDHAIQSRGWVTLGFPIEHIDAIELTNQGQESYFATRFTSLTPELGSAEPHLMVTSKADFDALPTKESNTLYLIKQTP